jgi:hypothetical protein
VRGAVARVRGGWSGAAAAGQRRGVPASGAPRGGRLRRWWDVGAGPAARAAARGVSRRRRRATRELACPPPPPPCIVQPSWRFSFACFPILTPVRVQADAATDEVYARLALVAMDTVSVVMSVVASEKFVARGGGGGGGGGGAL